MNPLSAVNEEARVIQRYLKKAGAAPFGCEVFHYDLLSSTQTIAKNLAVKGAREGTLVVAREQSQGYGRKGDPWHSAPGGLWFSTILRPAFGPDQAEKFSLAIGQAVGKVLSLRFPAHRFEVKAPNDVLTILPNGHRKKICGLILEGSLPAALSPPRPSGARWVPGLRTGGSRPLASTLYEWLVLGVGLNVNNELPPQLKASAATLEEITGRPAARMPLLKELLAGLAQSYRKPIISRGDHIATGA